MKVIISILSLALMFCQAQAAQKLFTSAPTALGSFRNLPSSVRGSIINWTDGGTLNFSMANRGQFLITVMLDSKLSTCTGACVSPKPGGSLMVEVKTTDTATNTVVTSQRHNGGMALLSGGIASARIDHELIVPVSLNYAAPSVLPAGNYRVNVTLANLSAMTMQYAVRQITVQIFEE